MNKTEKMAMKITEEDIARIAHLGGEAEEDLRQLFEWAREAETLVVQLWIAALLAVVGGVLASLLSLVPSGGYGQFWRELVAFAVVICALLGVVLWRWKLLMGLKERFLIGLEIYHRQLSALSTQRGNGGER